MLAGGPGEAVPTKLGTKRQASNTPINKMAMRGKAYNGHTDCLGLSGTYDMASPFLVVARGVVDFILSHDAIRIRRLHQIVLLEAGEPERGDVQRRGLT